MRKILFLILTVFLSTNIFCATITRYVNTGSSGGNGTTSALSGANAAYASLSAWEAAENCDLTDNGGDIMVVNCAGTAADTAVMVLGGWTTSTTNYIKIQGDNTTGKASTVHYRLRPNAIPGDWFFFLNESNVWINNIEFDASGLSSGNGYMLDMLAAEPGWVYVSNCIFHDYAYYRGVLMDGNGATLYMWNNVLYNINSAAGYAVLCNDTKTHYFYNNTIYGCKYGFYKVSGAMNVTNCIVNSNITAGFNGVVTSYCASDIVGEITGTGDRTGTNGDVTFVNVGAGVEDFHLAAADVNAKDLGTTDPSSGKFLDDMDGVTRAGTWDIGADEYVNAAKSPRAHLTIFIRD